MPVRTLILVLVAVAALVVAPLGQGNYIIYVLTSWLVMSIAAMGLNLTLGYAGQVSLAQAAFMGIGAYTSALLTMSGVHWIIAAPVAMIVCFLVGLVLGYPALRVQHHFLAFVTLAFNTLVFLVLRNEDWLTGGALGLAGIMRPEFFGIKTTSNLSFYYFTLVIFLIAAFTFWWLVHSPWGRAFKALRENPVRANSLGVDIRLITLLAFAIGSAMGGLAGALQAPLVQFIDPPAYGLVHSLRLLLMVVVGGAGFYFGPLLGAALVILLPEVLRVTDEYYLMIYAGAVLVLMIFCPSGLIGLWQRAVQRWRGQRTRGDLEQGAQL
jgi:branched-chain amino acid transport system permease protein